jgi:hypothetical protein
MPKLNTIATKVNNKRKSHKSAPIGDVAELITYWMTKENKKNCFDWVKSSNGSFVLRYRISDFRRSTCANENMDDDRCYQNYLGLQEEIESCWRTNPIYKDISVHIAGDVVTVHYMNICPCGCE